MTESRGIGPYRLQNESSALDSHTLKSGTIEYRMFHTFDGAEFGTFNGAKKELNEEFVFTDTSDLDQNPIGNIYLMYKYSN